MKVTVFTSNQPRHLALIDELVAVAAAVWVVQEVNTVFPGRAPGLYRQSDAMQQYFERVMAAERAIFGTPRFSSSSRARYLTLRMGDLNLLPLDTLGPALDADVYVVFGASYIKGPLCEHLVARGAYNLHMGVSPYYRGNDTNFWPLYDGRPDYVGATIHRLTKGLDSGPVVCHAFPTAAAVDGFELGMRAVKAAHRALIDQVISGRLVAVEAVDQDKTLQLRYSHAADFTDEVVMGYLARLPSPTAIEQALRLRDLSKFVRPVVW